MPEPLDYQSRSPDSRIPAHHLASVSSAPQALAISGGFWSAGLVLSIVQFVVVIRDDWLINPLLGLVNAAIFGTALLVAAFTLRRKRNRDRRLIALLWLNVVSLFLSFALTCVGLPSR